MIKLNNKETVFKCFNHVHSIPKHGIYTNDSLIFKIRYFTWMLPNNDNIYNQLSHSFQNITFPLLIKVSSNYGKCNGISTAGAAVNFIEDFVLKFFLSSTEAINSSLVQSKCYRHSSCSIFCQLAITVACHCDKAERKKVKNFQKK